MSGRSKVFGNWLAAEELAQAAALRTLRKPTCPRQARRADQRRCDAAAPRGRRRPRPGDPPAPPRLRPAGLGGGRAAPRRPPARRHAQGHGQGRQGTDRAGRRRPPGRRSSATWASAVPARPTSRSSSVAGARSTARGIQQVVGGSRAGPGSPARCSPHSLRHTFARSYLVNGGDVFSLQRILGHTTLDMVKRYVALAELEIVRRLHAVASPADRLLIGPKVSVILPRAVFGTTLRDRRPDATDGRATCRCRSRAIGDVPASRRRDATLSHVSGRLIGYSATNRSWRQASLDDGTNHSLGRTAVGQARWRFRHRVRAGVAYIEGPPDPRVKGHVSGISCPSRHRPRDLPSAR